MCRRCAFAALFVVLTLTLGSAGPGPCRAAEPVFAFQGLDATVQGLNRGLSAADLGFHPLPGRIYNEQKFFLCQCESGHVFFVGFYILKAGPIKKYGLSATAVTPDQKRVFVQRVCDADEFRFSTASCMVQAGPNYVKGAFPDYVLCIDEEELFLKLAIHDLAPGWRPGNGRVFFGEAREKFYDFAVAHSRATVTGEVRLKGEAVSTPLKGLLYGDHSYVNLLPTDQAVNWYSLRAFGEKVSVNYVEFVTPERYGSTRVPWVQIVDDQRVLYATLAVKQNLSGYETDKETGYRYPTKIGLAVADPFCTMAVSIDARRPLERFDVFSDLNPTLRVVAKAFFHRPIFYRFMSSYRIDLRLEPREGVPPLAQKVEGEGVSEVVFVK